MKRVIFILGLAGLFLCGNAQKVYTDSIDFAAITAADTVVFPSLGRWTGGQQISIEFDYTALDTSGAVIILGFSNTGYTFNPLDSVVCDTATLTVNGNHSTVSNVATAQATTIFVSGDTRTMCKYPAIKFKKYGVTSGKVYYYIMKL